MNHSSVREEHEDEALQARDNHDSNFLASLLVRVEQLELMLDSKIRSIRQKDAEEHQDIMRNVQKELTSFKRSLEQALDEAILDATTSFQEKHEFHQKQVNERIQHLENTIKDQGQVNKLFQEMLTVFQQEMTMLKEKIQQLSQADVKIRDRVEDVKNDLSIRLDVLEEILSIHASIFPESGIFVLQDGKFVDKETLYFGKKTTFIFVNTLKKNINPNDDLKLYFLPLEEDELDEQLKKMLNKLNHSLKEDLTWVQVTPRVWMSTTVKLHQSFPFKLQLFPMKCIKVTFCVRTPENVHQFIVKLAAEWKTLTLYLALIFVINLTWVFIHLRLAELLSVNSLFLGIVITSVSLSWMIKNK